MKIQIITGGVGTVEELINSFNAKYELDLKIVETENLEVNIVTVSSKKITGNQVFELGMQYQTILQKLKEEGKFR